LYQYDLSAIKSLIVNTLTPNPVENNCMTRAQRKRAASE
jgi:hypothetical protein